MSLYNATGHQPPLINGAFAQNVQQHLLHVSPEERAILEARLSTELQDLRQREHLYVLKRDELANLEALFRKRMDGRVAVEGQYKGKAQRNTGIIDDLRKQIQEGEAIKEKTQHENHGLRDQIAEKERKVAEKENEIKDIR